MKNRTIILTLLFLGLSLGGPLAAAEKYHYGMAGCGVGSMVFEDEPGKIQIVASLSNYIYYFMPQTLAITSGTSNCYESKADQMALYITINHVALQADIAKGQGQTLTGLEEIYGISADSGFKKKLQSNFNTIYPRVDTEPQFVTHQISGIAKEFTR